LGRFNQNETNFNAMYSSHRNVMTTSYDGRKNYPSPNPPRLSSKSIASIHTRAVSRLQTTLNGNHGNLVNMKVRTWHPYLFMAKVGSCAAFRWRASCFILCRNVADTSCGIKGTHWLIFCMDICAFTQNFQDNSGTSLSNKTR
jgi:hypothetical protein